MKMDKMDKMSKFQQLLSDNTDKALQRRAGVIAETGQIAQQNLVNKIKQEKSRLELKLANLTDFAPETTDSLRPGATNWDPEVWADEVQHAKEELYQVKISLQLAEETYKEFFETVTE